MSGPDEFQFIGLRQSCPAPSDWDAPGRAALWTYNLHYFDDLNAAGATGRSEWHRALVERWIAQNPAGAGVGWEAYPLSRRVVNWIKWSLAGNTLSPGARASLAMQARWLGQRLEYHLLGNHLFVNAKALVHAGLYFEGAEAERFLDTGLGIVERQIEEQILADGGHFERSPMYHAAALEDQLDLLNLLQAARQPVPPSWVDLIARMQRWLDVMEHPDGEISFFNDAALGIAPRGAELRAYAARLGQALPAPSFGPLEQLPESGYARLSCGPLSLIADCAPLGPDYLPAHGHADTLSFELSIDGRRVLVNSGTSEYGGSAERLRQRGTAAHNTVAVDGENSSEVWGGFRVARRARARVLTAENGAAPALTAEHDGYSRLRGRNLHRRGWALQPGSLRIDDEITGRFAHAEAFFHLHPDVQVLGQPEPHRIDLALGSRKLRLQFEGAAAVDVRPGTWHPCFGTSRSNHRIVARFAGAHLGTHLAVD